MSTRVMLRPRAMEYPTNPILNLRYTKHTKIIAFADDLVLMVVVESIGETENLANIQLNKIAEWAMDNKIKFNEIKSKVMLMTRRKRKERKEIAMYLNNIDLNIWV